MTVVTCGGGGCAKEVRLEGKIDGVKGGAPAADVAGAAHIEGTRVVGVHAGEWRRRRIDCRRLCETKVSGGRTVGHCPRRTSTSDTLMVMSGCRPKLVHCRPLVWRAPAEQGRHTRPRRVVRAAVAGYDVARRSAGPRAVVGQWALHRIRGTQHARLIGQHSCAASRITDTVLYRFGQ